MHTDCRLMLPTQCTLGRHRVSILPPSCLTLTRGAESKSLERRRGSFAVTEVLASRVEGCAEDDTGVNAQFQPDLMDWEVRQDSAGGLLFFVDVLLLAF